MRTFDTHQHIKDLVKSGFKEKQAEGIVKSLVASRDFDFSKLATKEQLELVEARIERNILKWMIPMLLTIIGMVASIMVKVFSH